VPHDLLGAVYEYLLRQFADESGKKAGEFFTPRAVVRLLVKLLGPQPGETIHDPACGSGGMLVETIGEVREHGGEVRTPRLCGQEVNLTTSAIARMNLYLHDIEDFRILRGVTLRDPKFRDRHGALSQFDVVIANPPFSLKNWGAEEWVADPRAFCGVPPKNSADLAWVQHMVASMKPGTGRVGVVMPHGVLFRGGAEGAIRQCLVEIDLLDAVIGLPSNLFYSTSIPACLLIFRATKPAERQGKVLFVDGSPRFTKGRNQNQMSDDDIAAIVAGRHGEGLDGGGVQARLVDHSEIKENGWDLNLGRPRCGRRGSAPIHLRCLARVAFARRVHPPARRGCARSPRPRHDDCFGRDRARRGSPCGATGRGPLGAGQGRRTGAPTTTQPTRPRRPRVRGSSSSTGDNDPSG